MFLSCFVSHENVKRGSGLKLDEREIILLLSKEQKKALVWEGNIYVYFYFS